MNQRRGYLRLLQDINPSSEIWWDAAPTLLTDHRRQLKNAYPGQARYIQQLLTDQVLDVPTGYSGSTTNPRLVTSAVLAKRQYWSQIAKQHSMDLNPEQLHNMLYERVIQDGAKMLQPLWEISNGRYGWLSAQVNPCRADNAESMIDHGVSLARQGRNIMIKIPASGAGCRAMRTLVAQGYSINCTFCYTVSQFTSCLAAIHEGRLEARNKGISIAQAMYVITFMIGRFSAQHEFELQAAERRISLTQEEKRWAEITLYQRIQQQVRQADVPARLLLSSIKVDQAPNGLPISWHLEKTGGNETVYTMTPAIFEFLVQRESLGDPVEPSRDAQIPESVLSRLMEIPYFYEAYYDGAIHPDDYTSHPAFVSTCTEALAAHRRLRDFATLHTKNITLPKPRTNKAFSSKMRGMP